MTEIQKTEVRFHTVEKPILFWLFSLLISLLGLLKLTHIKSLCIMNKPKHNFPRFIVLVFVLSAFSCQKYDDGPFFSLRSKKARVVNQWQAELVARNDIEVSERYLTYTMDFTDSEEFAWSLRTTTDSTQTLSVNGTWAFASTNEQIKLTFPSDPFGAQAGERLIYLDILRLKEDELWVKYLLEGDFYFVRLIPR